MGHTYEINTTILKTKKRQPYMGIKGITCSEQVTFRQVQATCFERIYAFVCVQFRVALTLVMSRTSSPTMIVSWCQLKKREKSLTVNFHFIA